MVNEKKQKNKFEELSFNIFLFIVFGIPIIIGIFSFIKTITRPSCSDLYKGDWEMIEICQDERDYEIEKSSFF